MPSIYSSLASILFVDKYSDLTITCGDRTFPAHRAVVCSQSAFFAKACDVGFKESISGVVDLPEDEPSILERFLRFLYTGTYGDSEYPGLHGPCLWATMTPEEVEEELEQAPGIDTARTIGGKHGDYESEEGSEDENEEQSEIEDIDLDESGDGGDAINLTQSAAEGASTQAHPNEVRPHSLFASLRVYVKADKFGVPALKLLARERFYRTAENIYTTCEDFPAVVDELYRSTPPTDVAMREIPCRLIASQYREEEALRERLGPVMREHGDLAVGVLHYMLIGGYDEKRSVRSPTPTA